LSVDPSEKFKKALAAVFREARVNAGLSQKKLAEVSGVGRTGIIALEAGQRIPSMLLCKMLADGLRTPLTSIVAKVEARL